MKCPAVEGMRYFPVVDARHDDAGPAEPYRAFPITYDYRPGWQLVAQGGVGVALQLERVQLSRSD